MKSGFKPSSGPRRNAGCGPFGQDQGSRRRSGPGRVAETLQRQIRGHDAVEAAKASMTATKLSEAPDQGQQEVRSQGPEGNADGHHGIQEACRRLRPVRQARRRSPDRGREVRSHDQDLRDRHEGRGCRGRVRAATASSPRWPSGPASTRSSSSRRRSTTWRCGCTATAAWAVATTTSAAWTTRSCTTPSSPRSGTSRRTSSKPSASASPARRNAQRPAPLRRQRPQGHAGVEGAAGQEVPVQGIRRQLNAPSLAHVRRSARLASAAGPAARAGPGWRRWRCTRLLW